MEAAVMIVSGDGNEHEGVEEVMAVAGALGGLEDTVEGVFRFAGVSDEEEFDVIMGKDEDSTVAGTTEDDSELGCGDTPWIVGVSDGTCELGGVISESAEASGRGGVVFFLCLDLGEG